MRKFLTLSVLLALAVSCEKKFQFSQPLSLQSDKVELEAEEGTTPVIVYANDAWTASLVEGGEWARLENTSGKGLGQVRFSYDKNDGLARKAVIEIGSAGETRRVSMVQKAGFGDIQLRFTEAIAELPRNAASGALPFLTNLPADECAKLQVTALTEEGTPVNWLSGLSIGEGAVDMQVSALEGVERVAVLTLTYKDALDKAYEATVKFTQKDQSPYLAFSSEVIEKPFSSLAASVSLPFTTNLLPYLKDIVRNASSSQPWARISLAATGVLAMVVDLDENTASSERSATLSFPFTDAGGRTATFTYLLTQKGLTPHYSFSDLKAMVTADSYFFSADGAIEGVVISDMDSPNMETAPNTDAATLDGTLNGRTGYIQSPDGTSGFRIVFSTRADNILHKGDRVTVDLHGTTIRKESNPERYTIEGITSAAFSISGNGQPVVREKTLAALTDSDVYTLVKVPGLEMSFKQGAYTNCHDGYSLAVSTLNPAGMKTNESGGSGSPQKFDTTPCSLFDAEGNEINLLINNAVTWRRYGNGVPQGTCSVTGIVVHTDLKRWARNGWLGRYQLRPMEESDIASTGERFSHEIVSWRKGWSDTQLKGADAISAGLKGEGSIISNMESLVTIQTAVAFDALTNYNGSTDGYYKGQVKNAALSFVKKGGYYWASDDITNLDDAPWFGLKFSTAGLTGSNLVFIWSAVQGSASGSNNDFQGPTQYKVEYSTDGTHFTAIDHIYAMHPVVCWNGNVIGGFSVPGMHQYVTALPASLLGQENVWVRVRAASAVSLDNDFLTPEGGTIKNYSTSLSPVVRFGELSVQYN
ncbi:MAG: BACON domain-containing protein [Bacteroidales bacterium]|nr:BACON domain-containing protein [Bacteroidales bacterium]